jgi:hypothetical protein
MPELRELYLAAAFLGMEKVLAPNGISASHA